MAAPKRATFEQVARLRTFLTNPNVWHWPILLQKSKLAAVRIFGKNLKRKEIDDSHSLSRATEVAHEFGARR